MKTVLIVDDQPGIRLLLKEVFTKEGYQAITAGSGLE
ncbi:MAG: response regulator, partial [Planococcus donghaensis]